MRPEALALFGLHEAWRSRGGQAVDGQLVIHLPGDIAIEPDRQRLVAGQSGLGASSSVFASAISWLLSGQTEVSCSLRASSDQALQIAPVKGSAIKSGDLRFEPADVLTASGKRRLCDQLLVLRAQLRAESGG